MLRTLRSKSLFYFLLVSLCGIFITSTSILWGFNSHFSTYLQENREKSINLIKEAVVSEFKVTGNLVNDEIMNLMHEQAMTDNLFYQMYNADGQILADTTMMLGMMDRMGGQPNSFRNEDYQSEMYELTLNDRNIGILNVYYPIGLIGEDFTFFNNIKKYIFFAAIFTLVLSVLFSMLFSKRLASGLNRLAKAVRQLKDHKWNVQVPVEELTDEMKSLGSSFNELAQTLAKEETLRKQFTADLAHELRTPLATLRSQIEAYQDGIWQPTPTRLQQSHDELMRLVRLVNELEKLLAVENPQLKLHKIKIEATKVIALVRDQFLPAFNDKGVNLRINDTKKEYWVDGDKDRIIQILTNIVNNALLYTHPGKSVLISPVEKDQLVGFSVRDEGIGIREEDMPFLFERFYRGEKSRNRKTGGIGIGLSIVKALVDAHHGEITIQSEVNKGTTISVMFPKVDK